MVDLNDRAAVHTKEAIFAVEATDFERDVLVDRHGLEFLQNDSGIVTVGQIMHRPVNLQVSFARKDGRTLLFWEPCTELVDHRQISLWLEEQGFSSPTRRADARNFHLCLTAIRRHQETGETW